MRETVESIVVAFILAFVFRAFIVEAFRIPTGSMAPTLYGAHGEIRCDNCAYSFAFNMPPAVPETLKVYCPNCRHGNETHNSAARPFAWSGGDRILVLKWPYDLFGKWLGPRRWDVAVFKDPKDSDTNFIKRLVGLPGEVFEIIDGDVYAAPADTVPEAIRHKLNPKAPQALTSSEHARLDALLKIQRKTRPAQQSLWMLHYDHDFPPARDEAASPAWVAHDGDDAESGWRTDSSRLRFDGREGPERIVSLTGRPIQDIYGYNLLGAAPGQGSVSVGDARLEFVLAPREARGQFSASLSKDGTAFVARVHADGRVDLCMSRPDRGDFEEVIGTARIAPPSPERPIRVAIENVDFRVSVEIDGQVVLETNDAVYSPSLPQLRELERQVALASRSFDNAPSRVRARFAASGMPLEVWHVRVLRDVYYCRVDPPGGLMHEVEPSTGRGTAGRPILLREDEFYACGDNSPQSKDSRLWPAREVSPFLRARGSAYQVGTVPRDQMIGKAFFVYWPAGKRIVKDAGPPIIPNVGEMRVIR